MYELRVVTKFAAAHQLTMVGTKCENMHGHNWTIEVYVKGEKTDEAGVLVDFGVIKKHVREIMSGSTTSISTNWNISSKANRPRKTLPISLPPNCKEK